MSDFVHRWEPGATDKGRTLLLLHGTGGDENDLVPLARDLAPDANLLSPRGRVLENGMPRFFRRLAMGVLDVPDLKARAHELADFVKDAAGRYGYDAGQLVALGYSNGANIATGLLFERPETLRAAVLVRAMVPYEPEMLPDLRGKRILLLAGRRDPYSNEPVTENLAGIFRSAGADVEVQLAEAGHEMTMADVRAAKDWLGRLGQ